MSDRANVMELFDDPTLEADLGVKGTNNSRQKKLPEDGKYDCSFAEIDAFAYGDEDEKRAVKLIFQILTGEKEGLTMDIVFWQQEIDIGRLFDTTTILTGTTPTTRPEALQLLQQALDSGAQVQCVVEVKSGTSKKTGNPWQSATVVS